MRVLLLLVFLVLAVGAVGVLAYRYRVNELRRARRREADLERPRSPQERYLAGEIDADELDRLLDLERRGPEER
jgi:uncharacterized membrane protein